jgi:hypothetical protein
MLAGRIKKMGLEIEDGLDNQVCWGDAGLTKAIEKMTYLSHGNAVVY